MEELKKDVRVIRESQIRMEKDLGYHIKRTDLLEKRIGIIEKDIKPLYVVHFIKANHRFIAFVITAISASVYFYLKGKGL